jgi:hypothetical protein
MKRITRGLGIAAAFAFAVGAGVATAGDLMSGKVKDKDGAMLTIESSTGKEVEVRTTPQTLFSGPQGNLGMADIDEGDRVRVISMADARGDRIATEVQLEAKGQEDPREMMPGETKQKNVPDPTPED